METFVSLWSRKRYFLSVKGMKNYKGSIHNFDYLKNSAILPTRRQLSKFKGKQISK